MKHNKPYIATYRLSQLLISFISTLFILSLLVFSKTAFDAALGGIRLWLWVVFPALFPFFVGSEILSSTGLIRAIGMLLEPIMRPIFNVPGGGSFAFAMGISSGYPVGAKITADMRKNNILTKVEAERLLCFTNNSGPLFITGAVATGMYGIPMLGTLFLLCHYLACITVGIIFRFYKKDKFVHHRHNIPMHNTLKKSVSESVRIYSNYPDKHSFGIILSKSIKNSLNLILTIGGFIVLFSVVINILLHSGIIKTISAAVSPLLSLIGVSRYMSSPIVAGFFEITAGTNLASKISCVPLIEQLAATSFIIGWAGISVHCQVIGIINKTDISIYPYLLAKLLQGIFASIYTVVFLKFTNMFSFDAQMAFKINEAAFLSSPIKSIGFSAELLFVTLLILILAGLSAVVFSRTLTFISSTIKKHPNSN